MQRFVGPRRAIGQVRRETWPAILPRIAPRGRIGDLIDSYAASHPTVGEPGATRIGDRMPAGFDHLEVSTDLPAGSFATAVDAVRTLAVHRGAGLLTAGTTEVGATVVIGVPAGPLALVVPCRIVWASSTGDEQGFGYATLPGHPEAGEEAFIVAQDGAAVTFTVRAFSRPAGLARLAAPLGKAAARATIGRYLAAMRELTA